MKRLLLVAVALLPLAGGLSAQDSRATQSPDSSAPYLRRGNEVEQRYRDYRARLELFYKSLASRLDSEAPDLRAKLLPPLAVPYGYQILPIIFAETPWQPRPTRIVLSPFSWSRSESLIDRDTPRLNALRARLSDSSRVQATDRRSDIEVAVSEYLVLVQAQRLMAAQIQYNRLWQGEVARNPQFYETARTRQNAALERQALVDSLPVMDERSGARRARVDTLTRVIDDAVRKLPTPAFVRIVHPDTHRWVLEVPIYTDIEDSSFVDRFRVAIESAWHVRDGNNEYSVALDIRRLFATQLYANGKAPAKGDHINVAEHIARFPNDGAVLTTGANTIYTINRGMVVGPHAVGPSALVHEFGHVLGFRDGYFRSYRNGGVDGYEIVEVILDPESIVAAPEHGRVRLEHFDQLLGRHRP